MLFRSDMASTVTEYDVILPQNYTLTSNGNWAIYPPIHYSYETLNYFSKVPNPAPPSWENWLGTDDRGRDVLARLIYGFRLSILFGLALTIVGVTVGIITGSFTVEESGGPTPGTGAVAWCLNASLAR